MKAIILFSHGSVLCGAERNLIDLATRMRERGDAPVVEVAFLNYTEPDLATAVRRCVEQGATRIVIAPYFLIAGKFVVDDLPAAIAAVQTRYPELQFDTAGVIGFHPILARVVVSAAELARLPGEWDPERSHNGAWCREQPKCPLYGGDVCRVRLEVPA